jgi:pyridoxal phosphate enzyme (YggS family)
MSYETLAEHLARVREAIAQVQATEGVRQAVTVVAVTKAHGPAAVAAAWRAGVADVGENRVQEAVAKQDALTLPVRWHLIGHLQTNKAKFVPARFAMVHSLDSARVAEAVSGAAERAATRVPVLLQVNLAGEEQKSGCDPAAAESLVAAIGGLAGLDLTGLMTMAPWTDDERVQRRVFGALRELRDRLATAARPLGDLSMGMSGDFRAAVAEGATLLRLGTVLFGERPT